jgi:hypothetical protein
MPGNYNAAKYEPADENVEHWLMLQMIAYGKMKFTPLWGSIVIKFSHLLLTISSALNIVIYSYKVRGCCLPTCFLS